MTTGGRTVVALLWAAGMVLLTTWSNTDGAVAAAAVGTLLAGAVVGRWWVLVVPLIPGTLLITGSLAAAHQRDADGSTGLQWAAYVAAVTTLIVLLLAIGVGAQRLVSSTLQHRAAHRRKTSTRRA